MESAAELCLHELFEATARKSPDAIAVTCGPRETTYAQLDAAANRLARHIKSLGARRGEYVALFLHRSDLAVAAILACHKAGVVYVPIDPGYPTERIRHISDELGVVLCLTDEDLAPRTADAYPHIRVEVIGVHSPCVALEAPAPAEPEPSLGHVSPFDLAYVIYTSGTTGRPKGIMTEHRNVTRFVHAFNEVCATAPTDRVYQGFSLCFDGSIEEIWMAFSNGSTLVVPELGAPKFGDDLARHLAELEVNYFSTVPTVLATLGVPVPSLTTVVLSGEVCPPDLVARWDRPGLALWNVYGPTEATVNTTAFRCRAGQPINIGRPLRGYHLEVVDEELRPVARGESGELVIRSETLARGYVRQPDLTAKTFVSMDGDDPCRIYRTGDLVRVNDDGEYEFFGRIDGQVKIRGNRVELGEIESVLTEWPQIKAAAVKVVEIEGIQEIAAYVVTDAPAAHLDRDGVLRLAQDRLMPYMLPNFLDVMPEMPRTTSGKVDRKLLPPPASPLTRALGDVEPPATDMEVALARVYADVLGAPAVSVTADFFVDLGGHSLVAARAATALRDSVGHMVTVRDMYKFPSVRALAAYLETFGPPSAGGGVPAGPTGPTAREVYESQSKLSRWTTWTLQALSMYLFGAIFALLPAVLFFLTVFWVLGEVATLWYVIIVGLLALGAWPIVILLAIGAKWVLIGRYKPGEHKLWSFYYFRFWLAARFTAMSGAESLVGTPVMPLYYRLMGARVGKRCHLLTGQVGAWDLLEIGDDTSIGADTQLMGWRVEDGLLKIGRIDIGDRCFVGQHSALGLDTVMGDDCALDDQSLLPDGHVMADGEQRRGSPAIPARVELPSRTVHASTARRFFFGWLHVAAVDFFFWLGAGMFLGLMFLFRWMLLHLGISTSVAILAVAVPVVLVFTAAFSAVLKWVILHRIEPGEYPTESVTYVRKWMSDLLMKRVKQAFLPVYTTLYLPPFLRMFGAKIARRAEISTIWSMQPELTEIGPESFFADGAIIGGKRVHHGVFQVDWNRIGARSFVGNSAILPMGKSMGDNGLLGVQSLPPSGMDTTPDGWEGLGSEAFTLTHRVKVESFDAAVIFQPSLGLYLQRAIIDGLRVLIPYYAALAALVPYLYCLWWALSTGGVLKVTLVAPVVAMGFAVAAMLFVAFMKKAIMGTFKPVVKPLWSVYVWLNEMINGIYESVFSPSVSVFLGTPFAAPFFRLMGVKLGRRVYLATTLFSEWDLVEIGDYAALNYGSVLQNHLFEDRVFKSSSMRVEAETSVGNMAIVLYDSVLSRGASLGPLSLLMKGETLPEYTAWHGIPCERATAPAATVPVVTAPPRRELPAQRSTDDTVVLRALAGAGRR
ncbi:peptide synthetase [Pilimelia terevasa]|uniref:Peptide synthetase n=1 Tax=Pilimelia terevasa TaxID=53372 RepID=A0A8J3BQ41_9ACTN|nr:Pls/PosA family non-ribosomal peptide synthetase [Pilimelia terevasa]GGK19776.1 peptide synthetase [Pilimelia terevasa]